MQNFLTQCKVSSSRLTSALNQAPDHLCPTRQVQVRYKASSRLRVTGITTEMRPKAWDGEDELWGSLESYFHPVPIQLP